ncbi:tRNA adenosine deaminase-associated protein [uncultured Jatrophihabitans sp.]|uniref:tRNA adenosine deaminase-associated protein n=1 Tax=uncultured Jatrophihabitans sp. TaxID=1610747 RepID=UPI0035CAC33C
MSYFAAALTRRGDRWTGEEADLSECESIADLGDVLRDLPGEVRLLVIEQDDEYAALLRLDDTEDDPRAFLSDGHAADRYPMAAIVAEELAEIGGDALADNPVVAADPDLAETAAAVHDSAPFGDADLVEDLGTSAADLIEMCEHQGTLPVDLVLAVCEKAGCGAVFEDLRG